MQDKGVLLYVIGTPNLGDKGPIAVPGGPDGSLNVQISQAGNIPQADLFADGLDLANDVSLGLDVIAVNYGWNGLTFDRIVSQANNADAVAVTAKGSLAQASYNYGFNGATFDRVRVANVFKTVATQASGNTAVWTPTSGKKFRLMGYSISASGTVAALVADLVQLRDGSTTPIVQHMVAIAATVTGDTQIVVDLGQGYLSAAANNVLNVNVATALTGGNVCVNAWGLEE